MKCEEYNNLIMRSLDHTLTEAEQENLEKHAVICPDCGSLLMDLRRITHSLENTPSQDAPIDIEERVMNRISSISISPEESGGKFLKVLYGLVISAALVLTFFLNPGLFNKGLSNLILIGARTLDVIMENVWSFQLANRMLLTLFSDTISSASMTVRGGLTLGVLVAVIVKLKNIIHPESLSEGKTE